MESCSSLTILVSPCIYFGHVDRLLERLLWCATQLAPSLGLPSSCNASVESLLWPWRTMELPLGGWIWPSTDESDPPQNRYIHQWCIWRRWPPPSCWSSLPTASRCASVAGGWSLPLEQQWGPSVELLQRGEAWCKWAKQNKIIHSSVVVVVRWLAGQAPLCEW